MGSSCRSMSPIRNAPPWARCWPGTSPVPCGSATARCAISSYDWMKLMIGARGALGILTGVNFKVFPLPQDPETARFAPLAWPQVEALRSFLLHSPLRPLAIELRVQGEARQVDVTYAGSPAVR